MSWQPPERPRWVERLIAAGEAAGGARHLVPLEPERLLEAARESTGLSDFGGAAGGNDAGDDWRGHYDVLLAALEEESALHLLGRTLVRAELLQALRNRLELEALWQARPEVLEAPVEAPVFIVGSPRSGTSILHELMATDPESRTPAMWEMQHPVDAAAGRDRGAVSDRFVQLWHDIQPEYETMHANSGYLPNECIFITLHSFLSDHWSGCHVVPSYARHLQRADHRPAYRYHARFLQTLQARSGSRRWLLKAPSHLFHLASLFDVYPDARIVRTHRDPLRTLPSAINLMGTLKWMRCAEVDLSRAPAQLARGYEHVYRQEIARRAEGRLPEERFVDVHYGDLVADPVGTVEAVYGRLGWKWSDALHRLVAGYVESKPQGSRGTHRYSLAGVGLDERAERERFAFYTEHYGVAVEPIA